MRLYVITLFVLALLLFYFMDEEALSMPYYILRTLARMLAAYIISLIFSLFLGIFIAHNKTAYAVLFPFLDILQSVPILAFLPFAVLFLIATVPVLGEEMAAIFLIFTSMTWAILFNVIEGVRMIPDDVKAFANLTNIGGVNYLFNIVLPGIYPQIISGSMTAWGGGWYFLIVGEYMVFGDRLYLLPGVGSFIAQSAYSGDIIYSLLGLAVLAVLVLGINRFLWQPLMLRTYRYRYEQYGEETFGKESRIVELLDKGYDVIKYFFILKCQSIGNSILNFLSIVPYVEHEKKEESLTYTALIFLIVLIPLILLLFYFKTELVNSTMLVLYSWKTIVRILVAYLIALFWTLLAAIWIGRNRKLLGFFMPIFDIGQSIPAVAIFPIIVVIVINIFGGSLGIEIASILLLLTGMQWYLLFNLIRGMQTIPTDVLETSSLLKLNAMHKVKHIILPSLLPAIAAGSLEAFGGGLNATIVSERIVYHGSVYATDGLGNLLQQSASTVPPDTPAMAIAILAMMLMVLTLNKFVWKRLLKIAEGYRYG